MSPTSTLATNTTSSAAPVFLIRKPAIAPTRTSRRVTVLRSAAEIMAGPAARRAVETREGRGADAVRATGTAGGALVRRAASARSDEAARGAGAASPERESDRRAGSSDRRAVGRGAAGVGGEVGAALRVAAPQAAPRGDDRDSGARLSARRRA